MSSVPPATQQQEEAFRLTSWSTYNLTDHTFSDSLTGKEKGDDEPNGPAASAQPAPLPQQPASRSTSSLAPSPSARRVRQHIPSFHFPRREEQNGVVDATHITTTTDASTLKYDPFDRRSSKDETAQIAAPAPRRGSAGNAITWLASPPTTSVTNGGNASRDAREMPSSLTSESVDTGASTPQHHRPSSAPRRRRGSWGSTNSTGSGNAATQREASYAPAPSATLTRPLLSSPADDASQVPPLSPTAAAPAEADSAVRRRPSLSLLPSKLSTSLLPRLSSDLVSLGGRNDGERHHKSESRTVFQASWGSAGEQGSPLQREANGSARRSSNIAVTKPPAVGAAAAAANVEPPVGAKKSLSPFVTPLAASLPLPTWKASAATAHAHVTSGDGLVELNSSNGDGGSLPIVGADGDATQECRASPSATEITDVAAAKVLHASRADSEGRSFNTQHHNPLAAAATASAGLPLPRLSQSSHTHPLARHSFSARNLWTQARHASLWYVPPLTSAQPATAAQVPGRPFSFLRGGAGGEGGGGASIVHMGEEDDANLAFLVNENLVDGIADPRLRKSALQLQQRYRRARRLRLIAWWFHAFVCVLSVVVMICFHFFMDINDDIFFLLDNQMGVYSVTARAYVMCGLFLLMGLSYMVAFPMLFNLRMGWLLRQRKAAATRGYVEEITTLDAAEAEDEGTHSRGRGVPGNAGSSQRMGHTSVAGHGSLPFDVSSSTEISSSVTSYSAGGSNVIDTSSHLDGLSTGDERSATGPEGHASAVPRAKRCTAVGPLDSGHQGVADTSRPWEEVEMQDRPSTSAPRRVSSSAEVVNVGLENTSLAVTPPQPMTASAASERQPALPRRGRAELAAQDTNSSHERWCACFFCCCCCRCPSSSTRYRVAAYVLRTLHILICLGAAVTCATLSLVIVVKVNMASSEEEQWTRLLSKAYGGYTADTDSLLNGNGVAVGPTAESVEATWQICVLVELNGQCSGFSTTCTSTYASVHEANLANCPYCPADVQRDIAATAGTKTCQARFREIRSLYNNVFFAMLVVGVALGAGSLFLVALSYTFLTWKSEFWTRGAW